MGRDILSLNMVRRGDISVAGGKGANLGEMFQNGFPVPPGFVVSARACEAFFRTVGLDEKVKNINNADPADLDTLCRSIRHAVEAADIPREMSDAIMVAHGELVQNRGSEIVCAVRSSATAEDLKDASFAGQHATYYYVDKDRLLRMIKCCWASLWNPEAVSYRVTQGVDHASVFMAVVVQEMIQAEVSGVTFTANPVTGSRAEIVTESSWGMGAAIVDGRVTPDHYVIERKSLKLREKRIAEKRFMVPPRIDRESKTRLKEVPHGMRQQETLSPDAAKMVAEWALKAEGHFGAPQDVEWSIADGQFYVLQSRPITVMGREEIGRGVKGRYVIFKPMVENFTDPATPVTGDLGRILFGPPLMQPVKGWLYVNLKLFQAILPFKVSDDQLAALFYDMGGRTPPMKFSLIRLPVFLCVMFLAYLVFGVLFARTRNLPDDFMDGFRGLSQRVSQDPACGPFETIQRLLTWSGFLDPVGNQVLLVNLSSMRYVSCMNILQKSLRRWIPDLREDAEALLCSGSEGVLSAEMGRGIWSLATEARRHKAVRLLFENHKAEKILAELEAEPKAKKFLDQLNRFLEKNGHRALKELELQSIRWEENPAPVLGMVRNYLLVETDPAEREKKMDRARLDLESEIRKKLEKYPLEKSLGFRWRVIRRLANLTKYFSKIRENSRFYHIMGFNIVRKKILAIESDLMRRGKLKCKGDIFYLHLHEISRMQSGELDWRHVEDRIRDRRMEHIRLSKMVPPKTINIILPERPAEKMPGVDPENIFRGQPASPGSYEGIAHVILDPSIDIELKPGEILVAPYTDPAWTPLFLTAGAAAVEVGSYLSHAGTVAREFGMPCVVDLPECTKRIQTGARIQVDGDRGIVRLMTDQGEKSS